MGSTNRRPPPPAETLWGPYLPVLPKKQVGLQSHPPSSLPLALD